jgi:hypothetical protein
MTKEIQLTKEQKDLLAKLLKCEDPLLQRLADELHYDRCHHSHTDYCGFGYGGWKLKDGHINNILSYAEERIENYKKVEKLYKKFGLEKFNTYMTIKRELQKLNDKEGW